MVAWGRASPSGNTVVLEEDQGAKFLRMDQASTIPQTSHGIVDEQEDELGTPSSSSSGTDSTNSDDSSEFMDDATSSSSSSTSSSPSSNRQQGALYGMSSLMAQLPFKRGLSNHFHGKSQSFTSLSSVRCMEDLAKPERPCRKKLIKPSRSYGGGLDAHTHRACYPVGSCSRAISKKPSRGATLSSPVSRRQGFMGRTRPPMPPHRSSNFSAQTLLFA